MKQIVFYSWQSDLANSTNRNLISDALKKAVSNIAKDESVDIEPVIDRDTQGLAGAPDISTAIFAKISASDVFVADVSIIQNPRGKRATPNPNVLIELGYALKTLGHERIILICNVAHGKVELLPFDLKMRRAMTYSYEEGQVQKSTVRDELAKHLEGALVSALSHNIKSPTQVPILDIVQNNAPNKIIALREYLKTMLEELQEMQPKMKRHGGTAEELTEAISKTQVHLAEFAKLSETIVLMKDVVLMEEVFKWFGKVYELYHPADEDGVQGWNSDGDFFKFIGHEMFVMFISPLLKEERWDELKDILQMQFKVENKRYSNRLSKEDWSALSEGSPLLQDKGKETHRLSLHSDILHERHTKGGLSAVCPFNDFAEVDLFLHLHGKKSQDEFYGNWYPHSSIWMKRIPSFITDGVDWKIANAIAKALETDVDNLKSRLLQIRNRHLFDHFPPYNEDDVNKIGGEGKTVLMS